MVPTRPRRCGSWASRMRTLASPTCRKLFLGSMPKSSSSWSCAGRVLNADTPLFVTRRPTAAWPGGSILLRFLELVVPEQLRLAVGEQDLEHPVIRCPVALLYRTDRTLPMRLPVIQSYQHARAEPRF